MRRATPPAESSQLPKEKVVAVYRQALQTGVPLEAVHQKMASVHVHAQLTAAAEQRERAARRTSMPLKQKILYTGVPLICFILGVGLLSTAVWPILSYYVFPPDDLQASTLLAPIPASQVLDAAAPGEVLASETSTASATARADSYVAPTILKDALDYTNLSNWFPTLAVPVVNPDQALVYTLDIPQVNINNAKVQVGGSNLDKNLIQYPGTALPGEAGEPVIFGHSILRQFYNPSEKNPNRYLSIFSTIMTLKTGDKIYLTVGNIKYTYQVAEKRVVHPEDTYILEQHYDAHELKLITCVPEGTTQDRGVVIAQLMKE